MPPPRRSYATPEETFGIAKKPLNDWFDFAASGLERTGPAFSADLEDADFRNQQRELEREKLRQQMDSEQAASAFMKRAAGQSPTGLMQMIADDPAILSSSGYGNIQDYVNMRSQLEQQKQVEQPFSNKTLAPALMKNMKPADQLRFQKYLQQGDDTVTAFDRMEQEDRVAAKREQYRPLAVEAAKLGGDPAEIRRIIETSDDPEIDLATYQSRFAKSGKGVAVDEVGEITKILGAIEQAEMLGDEGKDTVDYLKSLLKSKREKATPSPSAGETKDIPPPPLGDAPIPVPTTTPSVAGPATPAPVGFFEKRRAAQEAAAKAKQDAENAERQLTANEQWDAVKNRLTKDFNQGDPQKLLNLAKSAVAGEAVDNEAAQMMAEFAAAFADGREVTIGEREVGGVDEAGIRNPRMKVPVTVTAEEAFLEALGVKPDEIIGYAPSSIGGRERPVYALEAAKARLAELADPYIKRKESQQAQAKATEISDKVAKGLESISGTGNTQK